MPQTTANFITTRMETLRDFSTRIAAVETERKSRDVSPEGPRAQLAEYLDQQIRQWDLEISQELMKDTQRHFWKMGPVEIWDRLDTLTRAERMYAPMTPELKELLDQNLSTYRDIARCLTASCASHARKLRTPTDKLWTELAKVNAASQGLLYLTKKLYDALLASRAAKSSPTDAAE